MKKTVLNETLDKELILNETLDKENITRIWTTESFLEWGLKIENPVRYEISGEHLHHSFIGYLKLAYDYHKGIIIRPDFIWHTVLFELSQLIVKDPDKYRDFFTKQKDGKVEILVHTDDPRDIDLNLILEKLETLVPVGTKDFILNFSTTTQLSKMAINSAFCEAVSPYYDYMTFLCGVPKIMIEGSEEDWNSIQNSCENLKSIFTDYDYYFDGISSLVGKFKKADDVDYFSSMFNNKREGSGSKLYLDGWIKNLFIDKKIRKYNECPKQVSKVEYKCISTNQKFKLHCGLFSSNLDEDDYLVPEFGYVVEEL